MTPEKPRKAARSAEDPRAEARHRHRHDLLHEASARHWSRRCAAGAALPHTGTSGCTAQREVPHRAVASPPVRRVRHEGEIEAYLIETARRTFRRLIHPGHIVGRVGANRGHNGVTVLAKGEELAVPNFGLETVHHVHADDVAQLFMCAIASWSASVGEAFHAVSPAAVTLRGYAEAMAASFGREPKLRYLPWQEWKSGHSEVEAAQTYDHIAHSPNCSIAKATRMLDYRPRYSSIEAVWESANWLIDKGIVQVDREAD